MVITNILCGEFCVYCSCNCGEERFAVSLCLPLSLSLSPVTYGTHSHTLTFIHFEKVEEGAKWINWVCSHRTGKRKVWQSDPSAADSFSLWSRPNSLSHIPCPTQPELVLSSVHFWLSISISMSLNYSYRTVLSLSLTFMWHPKWHIHTL